jgi:hypothetical protein
VENRVRLAGKFAQRESERFVCGEFLDLHATRRSGAAPLPSKANDLKSSRDQLMREKRSNFSRGEVRNSPNGINRNNGRPAGNDYVFFFQLNSSYRSSFS